MAKVFIREVKPYAKLYRDSITGIAWIQDGSSGCGFSCHSNIDSAGSVKGMKSKGYWKTMIEQYEVMVLFIILILL